MIYVPRQILEVAKKAGDYIGDKTFNFPQLWQSIQLREKRTLHILDDHIFNTCARNLDKFKSQPK